jgi:hypothetical protein
LTTAAFAMNQAKETSVTGVVERNREGGTLTCTVKYDPKTGQYSGEIFDNGFSPAEEYSQELSAEDAKKYFLQLSPPALPAK